MAERTSKRWRVGRWLVAGWMCVIGYALVDDGYVYVGMGIGSFALLWALGIFSSKSQEAPAQPLPPPTPEEPAPAPPSLPAPQGVRATVTEAGIEVRWRRVKGATRHDVLWSQDERLRKPKRIKDAASPLLHGPLEPGTYFYAIVAVGEAGDGERSELASATLEQSNEPPEASFKISSGTAPGEVRLDASKSKDADGSIVAYEWNFGDGGEARTQEPVTSHRFTESGTYRIRLSVVDDQDARTRSSRSVTIALASTEPPGPPVKPVPEKPEPAPEPPEPAVPEPTPVEPVPVEPEPVPVEPEPVPVAAPPEPVPAPPVPFAPTPTEPRRIAEVSGRVSDAADAPLEHVLVTAVRGAERAFDVTRADGRYALSVNGGGPVSLTFERQGRLSAHRTVPLTFQEKAGVDVVLLRPDTEATRVSLGPAAPTQVVHGSAVADEHGARRAALLLPPGLTARRVSGEGTAALESLSLRLTEYTVGRSGPRAMPAELPPGTAYTYAINISADGLPDASVRFDKTVPFYVENFLGFPPGSQVPTGGYDATLRSWRPQKDGRVVRTLPGRHGLADVDVDGSGRPASPESLRDLGIDDAERRLLERTWKPGTELWRVPIDGPGTIDCNWPHTFPDDARDPDVPPFEPDADEPPPEDPCQQFGSLIDCQSRTLSEAIPIQGTSFCLHYASHRAAREEAWTRDIPLSGASVPPSLQRIIVRIHRGQHTQAIEYPPRPGQVHRLTLPPEERRGPELIHVELVWVYPTHYTIPPAVERSFGASSPELKRLREARFEGERTRFFPLILGRYEALAGDMLGGWTLSHHHTYDRTRGVLLRGDGTRQRAPALAPTRLRSTSSVSTLAGARAGAGEEGSSGDGGPARIARVNGPASIAVGPDGTVYFCDQGNEVIRRIDHLGYIHRFAGRPGSNEEERTSSGDGGPALEATFAQPGDLTVGADGTVFVIDSGSYVVRAIDRGGRIHTVVGRPQSWQGARSDGDGGPAREALLQRPLSLAVGPEGSLYIAEEYRIRRVRPDGIIDTIAGTGHYGRPEEGAQATRMPLSDPGYLTVARDGTLYFADTHTSEDARPCVWSISPDGLVHRVAGGAEGKGEAPGDGGPALQARLYRIHGLVLAPDGTLLIADGRDRRIRAVRRDGIIETFAGAVPADIDERYPSAWDFIEREHVPALTSYMDVQGLALGPDGALYYTESEMNRVRAVGRPALTWTEEGRITDSARGLSYRFDAAGRHVATEDASTGECLFRFTYDEAGRLTSSTDASGHCITVERDAQGRPRALVAPFGERTTLELEPSGLLGSTVGPWGARHALHYEAGGLLTRFVDPRGLRTRFEYDAHGRLEREVPEDGAEARLTKEAGASASEVGFSREGEGETRYHEEELPTGERQWRTRLPTGGEVSVRQGDDGSLRAVLPDGSRLELSGTQGPTGAGMPVACRASLTLPSGKAVELTLGRTMEQDAGAQALTRATQWFSQGERRVSVDYEATARELKLTLANGRVQTARHDEHGALLESIDDSGERTGYRHDAEGRLVAVRRGDQEVSYERDERGRLVAVVDSGGRRLCLEYDARDRVVRQVRHDGSTTAYAYDEQDNLTALSPPGRPEHRFRYTREGEPEAYLPPGAPDALPALRFGYEGGVLSRMERGGSPAVLFQYDSLGRLVARGPEGAQTRASHDVAGRVSRLEDAEGHALTFEYDGLLPLARRATGPLSGDVEWTWDERLLLSEERVAGVGVSYGHDEDGLLTSAGALQVLREEGTARLSGTRLGLTTDGYTYDSEGAVSGYSLEVGPREVYAYELERDAHGRVVRRTERLEGRTRTTAYAYDSAGRLVRVEGESGAGSYEYDANGNRTAHMEGGRRVEATHDTQDRLLTLGSDTFEHAPSGDLLAWRREGGEVRFRYAPTGELVGVERPGQEPVTYLRDAEGRRAGRRVGERRVERFLHDGAGRIAAALDAQHQVTSRFVYACRPHVPDYVQQGERLVRLVCDHLGSVRLAVDAATGEVLQRLEYDAFGGLLLDSAPGVQPFGFAGGVQDRDTGLIGFGARDYAPALGRFLSRDPLLFSGGDTHLYAYAGNDPINLVDPSGCRSMLVDALTGIGKTVGGYALIGAAGLPGYLAGMGVGVLIDVLIKLFVEGKPVQCWDVSDYLELLLNALPFGRLGSTTQWARGLPIRGRYKDMLKQLKQYVDEAERMGLSYREIAQMASPTRNLLKAEIRKDMNRFSRTMLEARNRLHYKNPLGPGLEESFSRVRQKLLKKGLPAADEDVWKKISRGATKGEKVLNNYFGWPGYLLQGALLAGSWESSAE